MSSYLETLAHVNQSMKSKILTFFLKIMFAVISLLPVGLRVALGKFSGAVLSLIGFRKKIILSNLDIVFGAGKWPKELVGKIYRHFGLLFIEMLYYPSIKDEDGCKMANITGLENLDAALEKGNGALIISGHTGNWEVTVGSLAARGYKVSVVSKTMRGVDNEYLYSKLRGSKGVKSILKEKAMLSIRRVLKKNEICLLVIDQRSKKSEGVITKHFGRDAWTFTAPYILRKRFKCPVVPAYSFRDKNLIDHHAHIYPEVELIKNDDPEEEIRLNVRQYLKTFEDFILEHPVQWIWMHERWRERRRSKKKS